MNAYTELIENNDSLEKIMVHFQSSRDFLYSGWEINQITNTLNNTYYKNELINTIRSLLLNGTNPNDIYILSSSVKVGKRYDFIKDGHINLQKSQDIINLYYMGSPIPLYPNSDTLKIYFLFENFRTFYKKCKSLGLRPPNRRNTLAILFKNRNKIINISIFKKYLESELYEMNSFLEIEELDEKVIKLFKTIESSLKQLETLFYDLELLEQFNSEFDEDIAEGLKLEKYIALNKYFNLFKNTFNRLERPFICVHNRDEQLLYVSSSDLIAIENFTEDNYRFFETKSISQNSPLTIAICIGIGFAPSLIKIGESILTARRNVLSAKKEVLRLRDTRQTLDEEILSQEEELSELKKDIAILDSEITNLETITTENNAVKEATKLIQSYTNIEGVVDNFIVDNINSLEERNNASLEDTLHEKKLKVDNIKIRKTEAS